MRPTLRLLMGLLLALSTWALAACASSSTPDVVAPEVPTVTAGAPSEGGARPQAVEYDLGDATIVQERFPEDSDFREMPVRLNGLVAVPDGGDGSAPVIVILHGTHPGCPEDEMGVDRWPCARELEQRNYSGFAYLAGALAEAGYVVLAPNFNAEHTFGFGEPTPGERLVQVLDLHLGALAEAASGGANGFGVDLAGRADVTRFALVGHSRGGEAAVALANSPELMDGSRGYGPVAGVLLLAAATTFLDPWTSVSAPLATILAACDGDVVQQTGQFFFEGPRLSPDQTQWATSAWLEGATHNAFNTILPADMVAHRDRPDCEVLLAGDEQRDWLVAYATDFLGLLFAQDPPTAKGSRGRMGIDVATPAPDALYGLPARVAFLPPAADRTALLVPSGQEELTTHRLEGAVDADGLTTHFCPKGFFSAWSAPGSEPCRRNYVTVPGQPAHAIVSWEEPGAALRLAVPAGAGDLREYTTLGLRAAVDPAAPQNEGNGPQAFSVRITDRSGNAASLATRPDEPALVFPAGRMQADEASNTSFFTGIVPLTAVRFALRDFDGVNLADVAEIAIVFDQTDRGTLFLADVELVREWADGPGSE